MAAPLIIVAAVTGGGPPRARSPHQPVTPDEIVSEALACWRAGAAMVHLHARTSDGKTTTDPDAYRDLCAAIRAAGCDAVLNLSAGDDGGKAGHAERLAVLDGAVDGGAEVVSLGGGSFNLADRLYDNSPEYIRALAEGMRARRITPEFEVFDAGHLSRLDLLAQEGLLAPGRHLVQFVTGPPGTLPPDPRLLALLAERLPPGTAWSVSAQTGDDHALHARLLLWAFAHGGHVRTGIEDMVWLRPGEPARSNADLVGQWADTARIWGRPVASPAEARTLLGIRSTSRPDTTAHNNASEDPHANAA